MYGRRGEQCGPENGAAGFYGSALQTALLIDAVLPKGLQQQGKP